VTALIASAKPACLHLMHGSHNCLPTMLTNTKVSDLYGP